MLRRSAVIAAWLVLFAANAVAGPAVQIPFNGPGTRWHLLSDRPSARIVKHACVPEGAHNADGAERVILVAAAGQSTLLACATSPMPVLDEFQARLWVKASQPGVQLAVRVVLPRSTDPKTGATTTTIVRGPRTSQTGHWQQLELAGLPKLLAGQVRVLRAMHGAAVDSREAFVDAIVLVVPGDPQGTAVLTDELEVEGILIDAARRAQLAAGTASNVAWNEPLEPHRNANAVVGLAERNATYGPRHRPQPPEFGWRHGLALRDGNPVARPAPRVRLQGASIFVDDRQFVPRAIEWNSEPLEFLAERGFNAVWLRQLPTSEQAAEAERLDLWFICPPPAAPAVASDGDADRVLAWLLEDEGARDDPAYFRRWADVVRERDVTGQRPVLIAPRSEWTALSNTADVLLARPPLAGAMPETQFGKWLTGRARLSRPGTPIWASIDTQFGEAVRVQAEALAGQSLPALAVDDEQLEARIRVAYTRGCRGFLFRSRSALDESDAATRRRATLLESINRRLQLVGPWIAGGNVIGHIASSDPSRAAVLLSVDSAKLLVPMSREQVGDSPRRGAGRGKSPRSPLLAPCAFVVPGVPDSNQVFLLSPAALHRLPVKRVAGGTRVVLESDSDALVVITQDPQVIVNLRQQVARDGPAIVRLERELADLQRDAVVSAGRRLVQLGYDAADADREGTATDAMLRQADRLLAAGRVEPAISLVGDARRRLGQVAVVQRRTVSQPIAIGSYPLALCHGTLAEHAAFLHRLEALRGGDNLLYGGDFEDVGQLLQFGWRHVSQATAQTEARAELSSAEPYHGNYCLRLKAEDEASEAVSGAPVRIAAPPIHVEAGSLIEITGWVRVAEPLGDSGGLQVIDSLGGEELSVTVPATTNWQPFHIVRAAQQSAVLSLSFSLMGKGTAEVDAVMVRALGQPIARRLPTPVR